MTTLLETALKKASELSEIEQNRFAKLFIEEMLADMALEDL